MSTEVIELDREKDKQEIKVDPWFFLLPSGGSIYAALGLGAGTSLASLTPRLKGVEDAIRQLTAIMMSSYRRPLTVPTGDFVRPMANEAKGLLDKLKPLFGLGAFIALSTLVFNGHMLMKRRTYDGGADPNSVVDALTLFYVLGFLSELASDTNTFEAITEGLNEALAEAFEILYVNPLTKFWSLYFGLENADDDEIKDIANANAVSADSMAYLALMSGLSNLATVAEIATGYIYDLQQSVRDIMREADNVLQTTIRQRLRAYDWLFNRITSELTELVTTVGQAATFAIQRYREIAKKYNAYFTQLYQSLITVYASWKKAVDAGDSDTADKLALDAHTIYLSLVKAIEVFNTEVQTIEGMWKQDASKFDIFLDELWQRFNDVMSDYENKAVMLVEQLWKIAKFYVQSYVEDMKQIIETIAKYRSEEPAKTINNFEFVQSIETPEGEPVVE